MRKSFLILELFLVYSLVPLALSVADAPRLSIVLVLWAAALAALFWLRRQEGFSWRGLWEGRGFSRDEIRRVSIRFLLLAPLLVFATLWLAPDRFLSFPLERPRLWLAVMLLYPLLSVVPQALIYRSFLFARYEKAFAHRTVFFLVAGLCFGFAHALYGNWIAPLFSGLGGVLFAQSYARHRSLKGAVIEHAAYGNLIFTLGIGWFFFKHG